MITLHKKPSNGELSKATKEANGTSVKPAGPEERTIAHIESWKIHSDYRRSLHTFEQAITTVLALYVFKSTP